MNQPRTFGPYVLLRRLAVGGMAEVYVASTRGLGGFEKLAALKLVHPHLALDPHFVRMLIEEAKISVLLTHANIAQVFDLGCIEGTYYIAMEFVDGMDVQGLQTTAQHLAQPLPIAVCAYTVAEMLNGLDYAHRKRDASGRPLNIVHRDISPQNVVVSQAGEVKLVDFGIAKSSGQSEGTEAGVIKGKYFYMSPEQAWGDATDRRSDVFSTGILLHEMLTGHMLYTGKSVPDLIARVRQAEIVPPTALRRDIPMALSEVVMRALQRAPTARFQSAIDMGEALRDFLYAEYPSFNAGKLGEFVCNMVQAREARRVEQDQLSPDDTRKLRALTRDEFVHRENSVLFNLRDGGVLATRQDAPSKAKRSVPPPRSPTAPPVSSEKNVPLGAPTSAPAHRLAPPSPPVPSLPPPASSLLPPHVQHNALPRVSSWPLENASARGVRPALAAESSASGAVTEDMEPTGRYVPAHMIAGMRTAALPTQAAPAPPVGAVLAGDDSVFDDGHTAGHKPALVPPRSSEAPQLTAIPRAAPVPEFRQVRRRWWLLAVLGVFGLVGAWRTLVRRSQTPEPEPHLEIVSDPSGAQVWVDGRLQPGITPLRLVGLRPGQSYRLEVILDGYLPWSSRHLAVPRSVRQIAVLRPMMRALAVRSQPSGALVFINDTLRGKTPVVVPELEVGQPLKLRVELEGYPPERRELTLRQEGPDPTVSIHFGALR